MQPNPEPRRWSESDPSLLDSASFGPEATREAMIEQLAQDHRSMTELREKEPGALRDLD